MTLQKIKTLLSLVSASLSLFSCATILNRPTQKISLSMDRSIQRISIEKAALANPLSTDNDSVKQYAVKRSRTPLKVYLQVDSSKKTIFLRPKNSLAFWLNFCNYAVGMLVDLHNPKRFAYSNNYHFTAGDTSYIKYRFVPTRERQRRKIEPFKKGAINLSLSISAITLFDIKGIDGHYTSSGIYGIETGVDYFYKTNHSLSVSVGAGTDILPLDYFGPAYIYRDNALFANVRDNLAIKNFSFGYGLGLTRFDWSEYSNDTSIIGHSQSNFSIGLSFSVQYRITKYLCLGILYQPCLWNTSFKPALDYQHFATFNVTWKFPIRKVAN